MKVLFYLLFLVAVFITAWLYGKVFEKMVGRAKQPLWIQEAPILIFSVALYIYILLLARYSSLIIVGFYFLSCQVPLLLNAAIGAGSVGTVGHDEAEIYWAGMSYGIDHSKLVRAEFAVRILVYISYPIAAGIVYFSHTIPSTSGTLAIIRVSLIVLFFVSAATSAPDLIGISTSKNLSKAARRRIFVTSLANLLPNGVVLTTLLWTFSSPAKQPTHSIPAFHITYSPVILAILASYFLLTLLVPYIVGITRGAAWRRELLGLRTTALARIVRILRTPKADYRISALSDLAMKLEQQQAEFVAIEKAVQVGLKLEKLYAQHSQPAATVMGKPPPEPTTGGIPEVALAAVGSAQVVQQAPPPAAQQSDGDGDDASSAVAGSANAAPQQPPTSPADVLSPPAGDEGPHDDEDHESVPEPFDEDTYRLARSRDPRFQYFDWIDTMGQQLKMTIDDLRTGSGAAKDWADLYEQDRNDLTREISQTKTNASAVVASTAVTSVVSVLFTGLGSWLWTYASHTLPK